MEMEHGVTDVNKKVEKMLKIGQRILSPNRNEDLPLIISIREINF